MTLYDFMKTHPTDEITVWDKEYDLEVYFCYSENPDNWDKAIKIFAEKLTVLEVEGNAVTVNLSEVIENNIDNSKFKELFVKNTRNDIMDDMQNILSGYVSETWLMDFAESLI